MKRNERILMTGGCGFVGHHFVEAFLKNTDADIVILDRLNYAGSLDRLRDIEAYDDKRVTVLTADFTLPIEENLANEIGEVDYIIHMGAESHVDNSITDPIKFIKANVEGTGHVLEFARTLKNLKCFYYFSTDEVFGSKDEGWSEVGDPLIPSNPYAAGKAGGEMLIHAYRRTYNLPCVITRSMNIFGERQHPEKFIPLVVRKVLAGDTVTIHSHPDKTKAGSRFYIHARNVADGYLHLMKNEIYDGEYHITGEQEVDNLELAKLIAKIIGKELKYEMVDFHSSRPGHDLRYALSPDSMTEIGWNVPSTFEESMKRTIEWTLKRPEWYQM
jgi:dTDP-glucose 4,6-dehydratase